MVIWVRVYQVHGESAVNGNSSKTNVAISSIVMIIIKFIFFQRAFELSNNIDSF